MKLMEWITNNQQQFNQIKNSYPIYFEYVQNRYKNFELLYEAPTFHSLLLSFCIENHSELKKIELIKNTEITKNDLGNVLTANNTNNISFEGDNAVNYVGLNVEGTFNKNNTVSTSKSNQTANSKSINLLNELVKLNNTSLITGFNNLNIEFEKLLVTKYIPNFYS